MLGSRRKTKLHRFVRMLIVGSMLAVVVSLAVVGSPGAASAAKKTAAKCDPVAGWTNVAGRPASLTRLGPTGMYVWNEKGVWRLSVTHADRRLQKFQGTISFDAPVSSRPVGAEGTFGDVVQSNGSTASFTFANYGGVDGIAVTAPCATVVTVTGTIDGQPLTVSQVFLGSTGANPGAVPVVLTKSAPTPTVAAAAQSASSTIAKECANPSWPTGLQGKPAVLKNNGKGATPGMYMWAEKSALRAVVVSEQGKTSQVDGELTANAEVRATPIGLEGRKDALKVEGNVTTFSFKSTGNLDGLELSSPCATQIVIEVSMNDGPITLFLGPTAAAVPAMPYLLTR